MYRTTIRTNLETSLWGWLRDLGEKSHETNRNLPLNDVATGNSAFCLHGTASGRRDKTRTCIEAKTEAAAKAETANETAVATAVATGSPAAETGCYDESGERVVSRPASIGG